MTATKHYENGKVIVYVRDDSLDTCITLDSDRQMRLLGECLTDLARTGGKAVRIGEGSV